MQPACYIYTLKYIHIHIKAPLVLCRTPLCFAANLVLCSTCNALAIVQTHLKQPESDDTCAQMESTICVYIYIYAYKYLVISPHVIRDFCLHSATEVPVHLQMILGRKFAIYIYIIQAQRIDMLMSCCNFAP